MNARDFIKQYQTALVKLKYTQQELERVEAKIDNVSIDLSGMPKATSHVSKAERYLIELMKAREEYLDAVTRYESIRSRMINCINMIEDEMSVKILMMRVIEDLSWTDIAKKIHYSVYYVSKDLYYKSLNELQKFC